MARVLAIGEVLWDLFPSERHLGGAPFNFCYHCHGLGAKAAMVSRVGNDPLGLEILEQARNSGIATGLVQTDSEHRTGAVDVTLDGAGNPSYRILEGVAWDFIEAHEQVLTAAREADVICFGSLAQRSPISRNAIQRVVSAASPSALRVFDINLRQRYYSEQIVRESLAMCSVLKLNNDELAVLQQMLDLPTQDSEAAAALMTRFALDVVAVTMGEDGARAWSRADAAEARGVRVKVRDTVGSGDAFTAAFTLELASGSNLSRALAMANAAGAYVASQHGATPAMSWELLEQYVRR